MRFTKGLNRDVHPTNQKEGTYRNLENGVLTDEYGIIQVEDGTNKVNNFIDRDTIDTLYIDETTLIAFVWNTNFSQSQLIKIDLTTGTTVLIFSRSDLGFNNATYFDSTYTINNSEETIIYWTDGVNPPRFYNITTQPSISDADDLSLFPHYDSVNTNFEFNSVIEGSGSLNAGVYYLAFAYIDDDQTLTDYFYVTQPIPIFGPNGFGADKDTATGKAINFTLKNLDTDYQRVRISAIRGTNVANVQDVGIGGGELTYTYTGKEDDLVGSLDEIVVDNPIYDRANSLRQHDGNLYMGGMRKKELSPSQKEKLQEVAINADVSTAVEREDIDAYENPSKVVNKRGFKRGEVYALYLSFIRKDGRETEAFHIPGRDSLSGQTVNSKATVDITDITFPDEGKASGSILFPTGDNVVPENGDYAYGAWEIWQDSGGTNLTESSTISDQTIDVRLQDGNGNTKLSTRISIGPNNSSSTGGAAVNKIANELNTALSNAGLDNDWVAEHGVPYGSEDADIFWIRSKNAGSSYNNSYTVDLRLVNNADNEWRENDQAESTTNWVVQNSTSVWESSDFSQGSDNTAYDSEITFYIDPDGISGRYDITINPLQDTALTWGASGEIFGGDSGTQAMKKFTELLNTSQSGTNDDADFSNLQNNYNFSHNGDNTTDITANVIGQDWNGSAEVDDASNNLDSGIQSLSDGFADSDGINVSLAESASNLSSSYTVTTSDDIVDVASNLASNATANSDISVTSSSNSVIIEETDGDGSYVGNTPILSVSFNTVTYNASSFTSPTTFTEEDTLDVSNPLSGNGYLKYQVFARPDPTNNMGFWKNRNENYPSEKPFISTGLDGNPVQHHRIKGPTYGQSPNGITNDIYVTGLNISGVDINDTNLISNTELSELQEEIVGFKLYYAKKDDAGDKLILDQGTINAGWLDSSTNNRAYQGNDEAFNDEVLTSFGFDEGGVATLDDGSTRSGDPWESDPTFGYTRPADLMINEESISGVTHVRGVQKIENTHVNIDQTDTKQGSQVSSSDSEWLRRVDAKSYIEQNQRNINLDGLGFSNDMDNLFGESKIVMEFDNQFISNNQTGYRVLSDICQVQSDVHIPSIQPGQISNYWSEWYIESIFEVLMDDNQPITIEKAIFNDIGGESTVKNPVFPVSTLYGEVVESRINTSVLYSGEDDIQSVYPQRKTWVARPDTTEVPDYESLSDEEEARGETLWYIDFFQNSDNYPKWNQQYSSLQDVKQSFPWSPFDIDKINNFNRVIRSAGDDEDGRSQSFRLFRPNDYLDLSRNRGDITSLDVFKNNLIIHMDRALIQTRGREELQTRDLNVFVGSGNIFEVKPDELLSTKVGFAGLQNIHSKLICEKGYFWVDQEADRIFWLSQNGLQELTSGKFGLSNYFNDNMPSSSDEIRIGYDPDNRRVIFSWSDNTVSFYPELGAWGSFHTWSPDQFIKNLKSLYTIKNLDYYLHTDSQNTIYGSSFPFEIEFVVPTGIKSDINSVYYNTDINESGSTVSFDEVEISNEDQTTGSLTPAYNINFGDSQYINQTSQKQVRKRHDAYWLNSIRENVTVGSLPSWAQTRKLQDKFHRIRLRKTIDSTINEFNLIEAGAEVDRSIT